MSGVFGPLQLHGGVGRAEGRRGPGQSRAQGVVRLHCLDESFLGFESDFESDLDSDFDSDFVSDFASVLESDLVSFDSAFGSTSFFSPARL